MYKEIEEGVNLFNDQDFFAAHDFFENLWIHADKKDRLFFQGMVQISVGGYHLLNENFRGAYSQFSKGTAKLKNYAPHYKGVELRFLIQKIEKIISKLEFYFLDENVEIEIAEFPKVEKIQNLLKGD